MQILSISGEKIASLAEPFEINLDEAPLSSAGLFAITGETGAGKSSLLDAMCLALYGNCPRLSGEGTRENVVDVDGQELRSNDPRMALRRGAAKAIARVVFRAVDGEVYAAEWMVRRAREKPEGRLQNVERSLIRMSDRRLLATQLTLVNERVVALTGLTYDEFRRTILLAQGDFDAFLVAKTSDRAAILEKVTGTGIYRDISRKVYERHAEARRGVETLETRRGEHRLLSPAERQDLSDEIETLRTTQKAEDDELGRVLAEIAIYAALEEARETLAKAELRLGIAQRALEARAADKAWLTEWDDARALRGEVKEREEAIRECRGALAARDDLVVQRDAQTEIVASAAGAAASARVTRDEAETIFKSFAADWTNATTLDGNVATAREEVSRAEADLKTASGPASSARHAHVAFLDRKSVLEAAIGIEVAKLETIQGHETFTTFWSMLEGRLQDRIARATEQAGWEDEKRSLTTSIAADRERRSHCVTGVETAEALTKAAQGKQDEVAGERAALIETDPADRLARLSQAVSDLRDLRNANADARAARHAIAASDKRVSEARDARAEAEIMLNAAKTKAEEAGHVIKALRRPVESADAAVTREAAHFRRHLLEGEPCPVCLSTTHPLMRDSELVELAKDLRRRLDAAAETREAAFAEAQAAERAEADATRVIAEETSARPRHETQLEKAIEAFAITWRVLEAGPLSEGLPEDPECLEGAFDTSFEAAAEWRSKLETDRDRLGMLVRTHEDAARIIEEQTREIANLRGVEREIAFRISGSETRIATLVESIAGAAKTVSEIDARVGPILARIGQAVESFGAGSEDRLEKLRKVSEMLTAAQDRIAEHKAALADLAPEISRAAAELSGALNAEREATGHRDRRAEALKALIDQRAGLLGGEATDTHRTRHNDARTNAQAALEQADRRHSDEYAKLARLESGLEATGRAVTAAEARVSNAEAALLAACAATSLSLERVVALHRATDEEIGSRRERIRLAENEKASAEGALKERQNALDTLRAGRLPEIPRDALVSRKSALESAAGLRREQLGGLSERQSADAEARERLKDLEQEIEAARGVADTWLAINEAIGAANGDRFAQIAQAVTLGLLVERANLHLQELKPRYRLEVADSDLALHVLDLDMAGDRRSTRSLSGGECFLVSLSLALALSSMGTHGALAGTLFIDEGFGSLDSDSLDLAIDALERLQAQGRTIGVISHVQAMKDRILVQVEVVKTGGGASEVRLKVA